jgi:hypothetical protein
MSVQVDKFFRGRPGVYAAATGSIRLESLFLTLPTKFCGGCGKPVAETTIAQARRERSRPSRPLHRPRQLLQRSRSAAADLLRPNHVGAAIARHKRAGRIEERDGKLSAMQSA